LSSANIEVFVCECIGDVPADRSELSSVLNNSVEERECEQQLFEIAWLAAIIQSRVIETFVVLQQILTQT